MRAVLPLLMTVAVPAVIALPAPAIAQASAAARLVGTIASDQMLVELAGRLFDNHLRAETGLSDEQKALLAANPGLKQYLAEKIRPELTLALKRELPELRTELTDLVERDMNAQDVADTGMFLHTPTGQKVLARIYQSIGSSAVSDEKQARQVAMTALMASLGPDDYGPLLAFAGTPAARKLQAIQPKIGAVSRDWAERITDKHRSRMERLVETATQDFLARNRKQG